MRAGKIHLHVLSGGSLVGQNILDSLETRREKVYLTCFNSIIENANIYRYDEVIKSPNSNESHYKKFLLDYIQKENPDLIFPGRDSDVLFLAELVEEYPTLISKIITGSESSARLMNDKSLSFKFAKKYQLPFAESFMIDEHPFEEAIIWAKNHGYPILAKPNEGFGSLGIRIITCENELRVFMTRHKNCDFSLQVILDFSDKRLEYVNHFKKDIEAGIPLFFHVEDLDQYAAQTFIAQDGSIGPIFTSKNKMVIGRCEGSEIFNNDVLLLIAKRYIDSIVKEGWRGFFNLQLRKVGDNFIAHEMNGRISGSTSARRLLGYDELANSIKTWFDFNIGENDTISNSEGIVIRTFHDHFISFEDMNTLKETGHWKK